MAPNREGSGSYGADRKERNDEDDRMSWIALSRPRGTWASFYVLDISLRGAPQDSAARADGRSQEAAATAALFQAIANHLA